MKKSKIKHVLAIIGIALLLFTAVLTISAGIVNAEPKARRILPTEPVSTGEFFTVSINALDYGPYCQVYETLPAGFTYTHYTNQSDADSNESTNTVKFLLCGETSFSYTVKASDDEGTYSFRGELLDESQHSCDIGGNTEIVVTESDEEREPTATRTLPEEPVSKGEVFTIELETSNYGYFGKVVETLPDGFVYDDSTLNQESIEEKDGEVEFSLVGEPYFTYTVTAPDEEDTYAFEGILIDEEKDEYDIGGDTEIVVGEEEGGEITRPLNITAWKPTDAVVNNTESELRTFNISLNQPADISWQINGTEVQTNESVTAARYMNTSAIIGTWNVTAIATNATSRLSDMQTWIWHVTSKSTVNLTSTPKPEHTSALVSTPILTPTPKSQSKLSPGPTSIATPTPVKSTKPALPGFELLFALAAIFAATYLLLFRKK